MSRRFAPVLTALLLVWGCAGPGKLAQRSEEKLAGGDYRRAWDLSVRALNKDPGNARARAAAAAAGNALARDWEQRIHVLAQSDSMVAAEQVLELSDFRVGASRYAAITVSPAWSSEEQDLRRTAARVNYQHGVSALAAHRPKRAWLDFDDAQRFVPGYRDAAKLADKAYGRALTRVAFVPFSASASGSLGREVASEWRDALARQLAPPDAHFTRVLGSAEVERQMNVSQLGRTSREDAIALGRKSGAERVVWGTIGGIDSKNSLHFFRETIVRRVTEKDANGGSVTRWVDVPIEVVARVRSVTAGVDYEIIATNNGATVAHQRLNRSTQARVVWTSYVPEGELDAYALVSDAVRAANPARAKDVETRWKDVCGEKTSVREVLEARRSQRTSGQYRRDVLPRFIAGAAFVFLQDLPPVEDLAFAALAGGWQPLGADLQRLDDVDDVDLGLAESGRTN